MVDATSLSLAAAECREATQRAADLVALRDDLVREALDAGWTHQQISDATQLSRGRIGQIAMREHTPT